MALAKTLGHAESPQNASGLGGESRKGRSSLTLFRSFVVCAVLLIQLAFIASLCPSVGLHQATVVFEGKHTRAQNNKGTNLHNPHLKNEIKHGKGMLLAPQYTFPPLASSNAKDPFAISQLPYSCSELSFLTPHRDDTEHVDTDTVCRSIKTLIEQRTPSIPTFPEKHHLYLDKVLPQGVKTIHVVCAGNCNVNEEPRTRLALWRRLNPRWKMMVHTENDINRLVSEHFPEFQRVLTVCGDIQKWDIARNLILYHYGGLYIDTDVVAPTNCSIECILGSNGFDPSNHQVAYFHEIELGVAAMMYKMVHPIRHGQTELRTRLANYALFALPRAPQVLAAIHLQSFRVLTNNLLGNNLDSVKPPGRGQLYYVIYTTGPDVLTETAFGGPENTLVKGAVVVRKNNPRHISTGTWWRDPKLYRQLFPGKKS